MKKTISWVAVGLLGCGLSLASCAGDTDLFGGGSGTMTGSGTTTTGTTTGTGGQDGSGGTCLVFGSGGTGGVGGVGAAAGTGGVGGTSTGAGGTGATGGTGGTGATGGTGGSGGTGPTCAHDVCLIGDALPPNCSPCVSTVCGIDPGCCNGADSFWGYRCVELANQHCSVTCGANKESCDDQYGNAISYHLCDEGAVTCRFGINNYLTSCATVCNTFGGVCLGAYDNVDNTYCQFDQWLTCDTMGEQYNVCVCSRGCGNGDSCGFGESCVDGVCQ